MSEELLQRDLLNNPFIIGNWKYYNIGATTIRALKQNNIIKNITYKGIENRKPDGIIVDKNKLTFAVIENKTPSQFNTEAKKKKAINQALEVSQVLKAKIAIVTDTIVTIWVNGLTGEKLLDENGDKLTFNFDTDDSNLIDLLVKCNNSISEGNSKLISPKLQDPTPLAKQIWQDIWSVSGATPENCLYTFVELFIFKYLSDLDVLKGYHNFDSLIKMYDGNSDEEVLDFYARSIRTKIKDLFPENIVDKTTIINGTIFVSKDNKAIEGYSGVFKKILFRFRDYGRLENIDNDFKSKLFESFLKESISKKNWGQFFTPMRVIKPMVNMSEINEGMSICDPACGVGKFLLEAISDRIEQFYEIENDKVAPKITLHGFDKGFDSEEQKTIILAKANMLIYFSELIKDNPHLTTEVSELFNETFILKTNSILGTLRDPVKNRYDLILTNPPYVTSGSSNLKDEIRKDLELESYYKANGLGIEGLFLEWIIRALKPNGKAFVVIPDGLLNRQNDSNLRKFVLDSCYIDALISLPLKTFFTTNKKTYILALTKKYKKTERQVHPVFTYLVNDIGETLDINRFETGENQLEIAVDLFNQFKGSKNTFVSYDPRCKVIDIDVFKDNYEKDWIIEKQWTEQEKVELGIIEEVETMSVLDFGNFIGDIADEIKEYKTLFSSESEGEKKKRYRTYKISDLFHIERGHSKYTKKFGDKNKGKYPVYSASNATYLTKIDSYDYDGKYLTWATNGFAGYIKVINGKFSVNGDRAVLIPKEQFKDKIDLDYVKFVLEPIFRELSKGRRGDKGKDEFTKLYPTMVKDVEITFPLIKSDVNLFDLEAQNSVARNKILEDELNEKVKGYIEYIEELNILTETPKNFKTYTVNDLFKVKKGKGRYTRKYINENRGNYPVYSSQTIDEGEIGRINTFDHDVKCLTWTTDGVYAGTVFMRDGKFSMTTHCGALVLDSKYKNSIKLEYLYRYLSSILKSHAIGEQNKRVTVSIIKDVEVIIPIDKDGNPDLLVQNEIVKNNEYFDKIKTEVLEKLNSLEAVTLEI